MRSTNLLLLLLCADVMMSNEGLLTDYISDGELDNDVEK